MENPKTDKQKKAARQAEADALGSRVRRLRVARRLTQGQLADLLPGVSQQSIDQLEQGMVRRPRYLPELAACLGVSHDHLRTGNTRKRVRAQPQPLMAIDPRLLADIVTVVEREFDKAGIHLDVAAKSQVVSGLYEIFARENTIPRHAELAAAAQDIAALARDERA